MYKEAEQKYNKVSEIYKQNNFEPLENYIVTSNNSAIILQILGDYFKAEKTFKRNLDKTHEKYGKKLRTIYSENK